MTTKRYLQQIRKISFEIRTEQENVERLRNTLISHGVNYSSERVKTSPRDRMSATIAEYLDEEKAITEELKQLRKQKDTIIRQLKGLDINVHYEVLYARYVDLKPFKEISKEMKVSERSVFDYHKNALREFELKYGEEYSNL